MNFPNYYDKHKHEALFSPKDFFKVEKRIKIPKKVIIVYSGYLLKYLLRKHKPERPKKIGAHLNLYEIGNVAFVRLKGIGAPHATTAFEELIELGAKEFLNIGIAGGLNDFGIILCNKAIRDEGTSHHYLKPSKYSYPDKELTKKLENNLIKSNLDFHVGPTWTIDAPLQGDKKRS